MKFTFLANISLTPEARRAEIDGIEHLVVPAVAVKEGVLNNILYPAAKLQNMVEGWNGVPVPIRHPMGENGPITANSPEVEASQNIGKFYNVQWNPDIAGIVGELWLNIEKAERLGYGEVIESLEGGEMMEISTGLLADTTEQSGEFESVPYTNVIDDIRPDHLALLPDDIGACSIEQGCGAMRLNQEDCTCGGTCGNCSTPKLNWWQRIRNLFIKPKVNQASHDSIRSKIRSLLIERHGGENADPWPFIVDVYDNFFIYELGPELWREEYHLENDGNEVALHGEPEAVQVEVQYVPVINKQTNNMDPQKRTLLVAALAVAAFGVKAEEVTEEQKTVIGNQSDDQLRTMADRFKLNEDGTEKAEAPATPAPQSAPAVPPVANSQSEITNDDREELQRLRDERATRLSNKRAQVVAAHSHVTEETAAAMDELALDALIGAVPGGVRTNFSLAGGPAPAPQTNAERNYEPPAIFLANGKETVNNG